MSELNIKRRIRKKSGENLLCHKWKNKCFIEDSRTYLRGEALIMKKSLKFMIMILILITMLGMTNVVNAAIKGTIIYDKTAPTVTGIAQAQIYFSNNNPIMPVTVSGMADTGTSGLKTLHYAYYVPGATDYTYVEIANTSSTTTINIPLTVEGEYEVAVRVVDNAGNWSNNTSDQYGYLRTTFNYYKNYTDGTNTYIQLEDAFNLATNNSTITVLKDITDNTKATVLEGKTYTLDLNGKVIAVNGITESAFVTNYGTLTVKDSQTNGKIEYTTQTPIDSVYVFSNGNIGTLNIINGIYTVESNAYYPSALINQGITNIYGGTLECNNTGNAWSAGIFAYGGNLNLYDGIINAKSDSDTESVYGIINQGANATNINILGGEINSENSGIELTSHYDNNGVKGSSLKVSGNVKINAGKYGIFNNYATGEMIISGGTIQGDEYGIYLDVDNSINITGGTIIGGIDGIINAASGKVIIGTQGGDISLTNPTIQGGTYGVAVDTNIEFYDGILKGKTAAYSGTITPEIGYGIHYGTEEIDSQTYQTAYLIGILMARETQTENGNSYNKYMLGSERAGLTQYKAEAVKTITLVNSKEVPANAEASWDVSDAENKKAIMAWVVKGNVENGIQMYDLYIGGNSGIMASTGHRLFAEYVNCESINTLNLLDTSETQDMHAMFYYNKSLKNIDVTNLNTSKANDMSAMFGECQTLEKIEVGNFNTSNVTTMRGMFFNCRVLETLDLKNFNTLTVNSMEGMFDNCVSIKTIDLSSFDTTNVTTMNAMFNACNSLTGSIPTRLFEKATKLTNVAKMFAGCNSITGTIPANLFINTPEIITFEKTFEECVGLTGNISATLFVPTTKVENFTNTFAGCTALKGSIPMTLFANTPNVKSFKGTFENCTGLTGEITPELFASNTAITTVPTEFKDTSGTEEITDPFERTFKGCSGLTVLNIDTLYIGFEMFHGCNGIQNITIGDNVKAIGTDAFQAVDPYTLTYPLETDVYTNNRIAKDYDWVNDYRLVIDPEALTTRWMIKAGETITLPITRHVNNIYTVNWGDGTEERYVTEGFPTHTYQNTEEVIYTIQVRGTINSFGYYKETKPETSNVYSKYYTYITDLESIKYWGNVNLERIGFAHCENLQGEIPDPTGLQNLTSVENMFMNCTSLTEQIREDLLSEATKITSAKGMYKGCINLDSTIPAGLFKNNTQITSFEDVFNNCSKLKGEIPADLFENHTEVISYAGVFKDCENIEGVIPETLFANSTLVNNFRETFANCTKLVSPTTANANGDMPVIPKGLFANNKYVLNYYRTFYNCTGLTGKVTQNIFASNMVIDEIPEDTAVNSNYRGTFEGCTGVTEIDSDILVVGHEMFKGCTALEKVNLTRATSIGNQAFYGCNILDDIIIAGEYLNEIGTDSFEYTGTNPEKLLTYINNDNEALVSYDWNADNRIVDVKSPTGVIEIITPKYPFTNTQNVEAQITLTDNYSTSENCEIAIVNEDTYAKLENNEITYEDLPWQEYIENTTWVLTSGDGIKTVWVFFRDEIGNYSMIEKGW